MTINLSDNNPRVSYDVAEGVTQSSFTVSFEFFDNDDLNVYVDGTLKTLTTDYTVSGGSGSTGTVTISVTGATGGSTVVITRDIDLDRTTDFPSSGPFNIGSLNTELDRFIAIAADLNDLAARGIQLQDYDTGANLTLPLAADRPNRVLAFNSNGDTLVTQELGTYKGDWAASTDYVQRDLVRDSSNGSIYIVNSDHTSTGTTPLTTNANSAKYDVIFNVDDITAASATFAGNVTINGDVTLGNSLAEDDIAVNGRFTTSLGPRLSGQNSLGSSDKRWDTIWVNTIEARGGGPSTNTFVGAIDAQGSVTIGDSNADTLTVNADIDSDLIPNTNSAFNLGTATQKWNEGNIGLGRFGANSESKEVRIDHETIYTTTGTMKVEAPEGAVHIASRPDDSATYSTAHVILDTNSTHIQLRTKGSLRGSIDLVGSTVEFHSDSYKHISLDDTAGVNKTKIHRPAIFENDVTITGNLTVDGTTTTLNSTELQIDDKNITLASGAADATAASGAGITIDGASATLTYDDTDDKFEFNKRLDVKTNSATLAEFQNTGSPSSVSYLRLNQSSGNGYYQYYCRPTNSANDGAIQWYMWNGSSSYGGHYISFQIGDIEGSALGNIQKGLALDQRFNDVHIAVNYGNKTSFDDPSSLRFGTKGIIAMAANNGTERIHIRGDYDTTTTTSAEVIWTVDYAAVEGGELLIIADNGTHRQVTKLLFVHDGTTVTTTQYGNVRTGSSDLASYSMAIENTDELRLKATGAAAETIGYTVHTVGVMTGGA